MTSDQFDRGSWERRWSQVVRDSPEMLASRQPNAYLLCEADDLEPGAALEWQVTAVDFSATALDSGRSAAEAAGPDLASRIEWLEVDLGTWVPPRARFDLVSCLYVHVAGPVTDLVARLGDAVAPGGTLLLVGHRPVDPETGAPTPAAGQVQVSVEEALAVLEPDAWRIVVAEERTRSVAGTGVDAVIRAVRRR